jgi:hypothetical protein|tara:strand:- start:286 stop:414 length:129 start_codon:yes stop_codon:yes gene_type:complete
MKTPDFLLRKSTLEDSGVKRNPPCIRGGIRGGELYKFIALRI